MTDAPHVLIARENIRKLLELRSASSFDISTKLGRDRTYLDDFLKGRKQSLSSRFSQDLSRFLNIEERFVQGHIALGTELNDEDTGFYAHSLKNMRTKKERYLREIAERESDKLRVSEEQRSIIDEEIQDLKEFYSENEYLLQTMLRVVGRSTKHALQENNFWHFPDQYVKGELGTTSQLIEVFRVDDSSMQKPSQNGLSPGDYVLVDVSKKDVSLGGMFAIKDGHQILIRYVEVVRGSEPQKIICRASNSDFPVIELVQDSRVRIVGKVVAEVKRV